MAGVAELTHPAMVEYGGVVYITGYRNGAQYLRKTVDGCRTWLRFADGGVERLIGAPADEVRAGLIKMDSQGRQLVVAVARRPYIDVYVSADDGETWAKESTV
jgi:hypothetical protein